MVVLQIENLTTMAPTTFIPVRGIGAAGSLACGNCSGASAKARATEGASKTV